VDFHRGGSVAGAWVGDKRLLAICQADVISC
jgi:hypothetical protein